MILNHRQTRGGFTLLEVLLASAIAILLLGALYVSFEMTLKQTDAARDSVEDRGELMRGIANRLNVDLACCIGPMPPKSGGGIPEDTSATSGTTTASTSSTTTSTTTTTTSADVAAGVAAGTTDLSLSEGVSDADVAFQGGLFGDGSQLTLFVSRVPPSLASPETADPASDGLTDGRSDLRRVTYYLGPNGGLCRQEKPWVTADGIRNSTTAVAGEDANDMIATEVTAVTFSYFDGTQWTDTWVGSDPTTDGKSVKGPPRAIKITMTIKQPGVQEQRTVSHVIAVRAAVGLSIPPVVDDTTTDPATTGM